MLENSIKLTKTGWYSLVEDFSSAKIRYCYVTSTEVAYILARDFSTNHTSLKQNCTFLLDYITAFIPINLAEALSMFSHGVFAFTHNVSHYRERTFLHKKYLKLKTQRKNNDESLISEERKERKCFSVTATRAQNKKIWWKAPRWFENRRLVDKNWMLWCQTTFLFSFENFKIVEIVQNQTKKFKTVDRFCCIKILKFEK